MPRSPRLVLLTALNTLGPLLLMGLAWGSLPGFFADPVRALAALLYVLPTPVVMLFTTGFAAHAHARAAREGPGFLAAANLAANLGFLLAIFLDARGIARLPGGEPLRWAGLAVLVAGTALRVATMLALGRFFSLRVSVEDDHRLITTGLYARVRHPSYLSVIVLCVGIAGAFRSGAWLALIPFMVYGLVRRMGTEERFLVEHFGDEYRAYMARTARLLPGLY